MMSAVLGGERLTAMETGDEGHTNGHGTPPPFNGGNGGPRRMPVKTRRVDLDGDYEGWCVVLRTNAPFGLYLALTELQSAGEDGVQAFARLAELLPKMIVSWNFVDEEGAPIPCDATGVRAIPTDLLMGLVQKVAEGDTLPKA